MDSSVLMVKQKLRAMILDAVRQGVSKLPSEPDLAHQLGVSRETIRASVAALQKEGIVNRLHGKGTFVNVGAVRQTGNLIEGKPFLTMIEEAGYEATTRAVDMGQRAFDDASDIGDIGRRFVRSECMGDGTYRAVKRHFFGDDCPIILAIDFIFRNWSDMEKHDLEPGESIYAMARLNMGEQIAYSVAEILPAIACDYLAGQLHVDVGRPLLLLKHAHYFQLEHNPVAITCAFVNTGKMKMSIVRTGYDV
ncbi:hypothetical protein AAC03nite_24050 [Alicyclobacillus acidoterrestris]|uniref:GntR family transcriptional regulator n=1 Tax=Alicyclobacillus suci TaxID=2816080 RepID=UPI00118EE320|nr:GntR family transcriptional regulator [Alicyclobacillus suci]GEO26620.1 hypothetical protein AAC03nite_24050 [Alicyclobacillus acidoterrestris]